MSQENLDQFKRLNEASNRRDIDALLETFDSAVVWRPEPGVLLTGGGEVYPGHDGVREMFRGFYDVLDEIHVEYSEIRDLGDQVVGIGRLRMRGKASGAATESPFACISDFKNGKVILVRTSLDPDEALEAAGLSE